MVSEETNSEENLSREFFIWSEKVLEKGLSLPHDEGKNYEGPSSQAEKHNYITKSHKSFFLGFFSLSHSTIRNRVYHSPSLGTAPVQNNTHGRGACLCETALHHNTKTSHFYVS